MSFSVTKNGEPLSKRKYKWDEETLTFSTKEIGLVIDFHDIDGVTFKTGAYCTFNTGNRCTFKTGHWCTFKTGNRCTFDTGNVCTFYTGDKCTFYTGSVCFFHTGDYCMFNTGDYCMLKTGKNCTFMTNMNCTFRTGPCCTFKTGPNCTFYTGTNCFTTQYDVKGVFKIPQGKTIKLFNEYGKYVYTEVPPTHTIVIDGKEEEISDEMYQTFKESLTH